MQYFECLYDFKVFYYEEDGVTQSETDYFTVPAKSLFYNVTDTEGTNSDIALRNGELGTINLTNDFFTSYFRLV